MDERASAGAIRRSAMNVVPLDRAVVCEDCRSVTDGRTNCAACGSSAVWKLSSIVVPVRKPAVRLVEKVPCR